MNQPTQIKQNIVDELSAVVGVDHVLTDVESCILYAQDVFTKSIPAAAVVQPENTAQLSAAVKAATEAGCAVVARGGGMSYTSGYVPAQDGTVVVDMSRMNRVLEVNTEDMYVSVECGCTWAELHAALENTGFRTPYWGTLSGRNANVGGGLSQNAIFWGSGQFGSAADNVISLDVVLADGSVIKTGSAAQNNSKPFFRHFGPDLTGIFTADCGALGFKATATLRLIRQFKGRQFCAFDFKTAEDAICAMSEISRRGLAMECFGFDPFLQHQRMTRESLAADVKAFTGVLKSAGSVMGALKDGAKIALAGRRYMDDVDYSVQIMIEDYTQAGADARAAEIVEVAQQFNGSEIENSIPKIARANPFGPMNNMLGASGERWVPVHALVAHSDAVAAYQAVAAIFESHRAEFEKHKIEVGYLFAVVSTNCFVLEPVFFWEDATTEIHKASVEADFLAKLKEFPESLEARELVGSVRKEIAKHFSDKGGVHLQIGKAYHYHDGIGADSLALVKAIKQATDPKGLVNPGVLGLG